MDSPELFIAFGAVMLVVALLGVAVDWVGKPLKHRRFVPKAYRYPDERQPRRSRVRSTDWSDTSFVLPVVEEQPRRQRLRYPDARAAALSEAASVMAGSADPPTAMVPPVELDVDPVDLPIFDPREPDDLPDDLSPGVVRTAGDLDAEPDGGADPEPDQGPADEGPEDESHVEHEPGADEAGAPTDGDDAGAGPEPDLLASIVTLEEADPDSEDLVSLDSEATEEPQRARGWRPGQYVFNLTSDGREPSSTTVRTRYWKNVADTGGAGIFGAANVARMTEGRPPKRWNHRTGRTESMLLPAADYDVAGGQTPVPSWPGTEVDPFA